MATEAHAEGANWLHYSPFNSIRVGEGFWSVHLDTLFSQHC